MSMLRLTSLSLVLLAWPTLASAQVYDQGGYSNGPYVEYDPADYDAYAHQQYETDYDAAENDFDAPDADYVWEDGYILADGTAVAGFYRLRHRPDCRWVPGMYRNGAWVAGHWQPANMQRSYVWERGFRGPDGFWVNGYSRPAHRPGWIWVAAGRHNGTWMHAHWRPAQEYRGYVWEPGHWSKSGQWMDGFWRETHRPSQVWIAGQWRYGRWVPGYWQPVQERPGHVWVGGYHGPSGWVGGQWRPARRQGYVWVQGSWGARGWISGHWERARARKATRQHRIRRVNRMIEARQPYVRHWRNGKIVQRKAQRFNRGVRVEKRGAKHLQRGKRMQERSKHLKHRGRVTGDRKLERKGKKLQRRGKKLERKGKREIRRGQRIQDRSR